MSSTRSIIAPPPFAANALTVIPPTPVAGVSYRDPAAGPASSPDGWPYAERVNSAEWNQIMYQISSLVALVDKKGVLGWSSAVDYTESSIVFGSDGALYVWLAISGPAGPGAKDPISEPAFWASLKASVSTAQLNKKRSTRAALATAGSSVTITDDEVIVKAALGGLSYLLPSFSQVINLATTGAGGMNTGSAPVNGSVAIYAIYNPGANTRALYAVNATSAVQPEICGVAMPTGFTASSLLSVWRTNGSGQLVVGNQIGRCISFPTVQVLSALPAVPITQLACPSALPPNALSCRGEGGYTAPGNGSISTTLYSDAQSSGRQFISGNPVSGGSGAFEVGISVPGNIFYSAATTVGSTTFTINISSYEF